VFTVEGMRGFGSGGVGADAFLDVLFRGVAAVV